MLEVLDFSADWCGPCLMMKQVLPEVERELSGQASFRQVNVDDNQEEASRYQVMSIPTFVILKEGQEVARRTGFIPKEQMVLWVKEHLEI